ncbi:hypothetical protein P7C70_g7475, partial [Phenoliferia sp. Uapishka_3]
MSSPHIVIIGSGLTALTLARTLLLPPFPQALTLSLIDKAKAPGGRLTTRYYDSGTYLEPGARVFESPSGNAEFERAVERWESKGWVKEVEKEKIVGCGTGRHWEGVGGWTKGLIEGMVEEVRQVGKDRVQFYFGNTAINPSPVSLTSNPISLTLTPALSNLSPISFLIHTAPTSQTSVILPSTSLPTIYARTFSLLLPTISLLTLPSYHRHPHPDLTSISTGYSSTGEITGICIQSTPERLGLTYDSTDGEIRRAIFEILRSTTPALLPADLVSHAERLVGRESQVKRWKFAQVEKALGDRGIKVDCEKVLLLEGGKVLVAGDGTSGGVGGVEGAWSASAAASLMVKKWLDGKQTKGNL